MSIPTNPKAQSSLEGSIHPPSPRTQADLILQHVDSRYKCWPGAQCLATVIPDMDHATLLRQSEAEGFIQPSSSQTAAAQNKAIYKTKFEEEWRANAARESHEFEMRYNCDPIEASCGCVFEPCNIALGGKPSLLPFLPEPHFWTMMRKALYSHQFNHRAHFENMHKMIGLDPDPKKTAEEVRGVAHIPWLLNNP